MPTDGTRPISFIAKCDRFVRASTETAIEDQIGFSFILGFVLAPWSGGIFLLIVSLVLWVIIFAVIAHKYWDPYVRAGIIAASLLGWLAGRALTRTGIDETGSVPRILRGGAYIDNATAHSRRRIQIRRSIIDHVSRSIPMVPTRMIFST